MWMWCRTKAVQWKLSEKLSVFCLSGIHSHHLWSQKDLTSSLLGMCVCISELAQVPHSNRVGKIDPATVLKPQSRAG